MIMMHKMQATNSTSGHLNLAEQCHSFGSRLT